MSESQQRSGGLTLGLQSLAGVALQQLHLLPPDQGLLHLPAVQRCRSAGQRLHVHRNQNSSHLLLRGNGHVCHEADPAFVALLLVSALLIVGLKTPETTAQCQEVAPEAPPCSATCTWRSCLRLRRGRCRCSPPPPAGPCLQTGGPPRSSTSGPLLPPLYPTIRPDAPRTRRR